MHSSIKIKYIFYHKLFKILILQRLVNFLFGVKLSSLFKFPVFSFAVDRPDTILVNPVRGITRIEMYKNV
jgi:hypothetical protein